MRRRSLLLGLGGAAGGAALLGSGAFTSVTANRTATVNVTGDANAFLRLEPFDGPNGAYAENDGGTLALTLDDSADENSSAGTPSGRGLGQNSTYTFDNVFLIQNQGTQTVGITADVGKLTGQDGHDGLESFYLYDSSSSPSEGRFSEPKGEDEDPAIELGPGDKINVGVRAVTTSVTPENPPSLDITITADAAVQGTPGGAPTSSALIVDKNDETAYQSISAAQKDATSGDTIEIRGGPYNEAVEIETEGLTIRGSGQPKIRSGDRNRNTISVSAPNVTLSDLAVRGRSTDGSANLGAVIIAQGSVDGLTVRDCTIEMPIVEDTDGDIHGPTGGILTFGKTTIEGTRFQPVDELVDKSPKAAYRQYDDAHGGAVHDYAIRITNTYATAGSVVRDCTINRAKSEEPRNPDEDPSIRNGIFLTNAKDTTIEDCDINDCTRRLDFPQDSERDGEYRSGSGINLQSRNRGKGPKVAKNIRIRDNELRNNGTGVFLDAQLGSGIAINENDIVGNSMAVTTFANEQTPEPVELRDPVRTGIVLNQGRSEQAQQRIDATRNWFGSPGGPLLGDKVLANAEVSPWYDGDSDEESSSLVYEEPE